ncbi:hypothetical protein EIP86_009039 [Pleurotus ostreatoroseus]|nr:hypothetical protein EIP86_009039 [Pleurotus ostreatoroseus]
MSDASKDDSMPPPMWTTELEAPATRACQRTSCGRIVDLKKENMQYRKGYGHGAGTTFKWLCTQCSQYYNEKTANMNLDNLDPEKREGYIEFTRTQRHGSQSQAISDIQDIRKANAASQRAASNIGENMYPSRRLGAGYDEKSPPVNSMMGPPEIPSGKQRNVVVIGKAKGYTRNHREYAAHRAQRQQAASGRAGPAAHIGERKGSVLFAMHYEREGRSGTCLLSNIEQEAEISPTISRAQLRLTGLNALMPLYRNFAKGFPLDTETQLRMYKDKKLPLDIQDTAHRYAQDQCLKPYFYKNDAKSTFNSSAKPKILFVMDAKTHNALMYHITEDQFEEENGEHCDSDSEEHLEDTRRKRKAPELSDNDFELPNKQASITPHASDLEHGGKPRNEADHNEGEKEGDHTTPEMKIYEIPRLLLTELPEDFRLTDYIQSSKTRFIIAKVNIETGTYLAPKGGFKTCHAGTIFPLTSSSSRDILRLFDSKQPAVAAKRCYFNEISKGGPGSHQALGTGRTLKRYDNLEREVSLMLDEANCLCFGTSLMLLVNEFIRHKEDEWSTSGLVSRQKRTPPPLSFVRAAIAVPTDGSQAVYLLEELIEDQFYKYIANSRAVPSLNLPDNAAKIAEYLCFVQHAQYNLTKGLMFTSDFQGGGLLLTDCQIITARGFDDCFGDGNLVDVFERFEYDHQCNSWCEYFELEPFQRAMDAANNSRTAEANVEGEDEVEPEENM